MENKNIMKKVRLGFSCNGFRKDCELEVGVILRGPDESWGVRGKSIWDLKEKAGGFRRNEIRNAVGLVAGV